MTGFGFKSGASWSGKGWEISSVAKIYLISRSAGRLSETSQTIIATLINSGPAWAQGAVNAGGVPEWQRHITNLPSRADLFAATVGQYLGYVNTSGNMSIQRLSAIFGVYGELPLVAVRLDDGFVLMDPLAGNLSGPFAPDSVLDARGLLSAYEGDGVYEAGTGVRYLTSAGCPTTVAADWNPTWPGPGPAPVPTPAVPAVTPTPPTPPTPDVPAGGNEPFICQDAPRGGYTCTRYFCATPATPTVPACPPSVTAPSTAPGLLLVPASTIPVRQRCTVPAACTPVNHPASVSPKYPCGKPNTGNDTCAAPPGECTPTCTIEYYY